ncbi:flagellar biosynthesis anti-sigma factor FlgM [Bacillus sp. JJ722]|uniref:flagellar biosynthesis anti-sigma factor FlgM n=1 Tax=Bacillus sp. JJ722 TaxID=3122973 RepID=UPI002FFFFF0A
MKINNVGPTGMNPYKTNLNKLEAKQSLFNKKDKIEISTTAKDLQQSSQIVAQRQEKVQQLKLSVENGTYKLDPRGTARSLVDFYSKK